MCFKTGSRKYDVCRLYQIITFVDYDICRIIEFVPYDVCYLLGFVAVLSFIINTNIVILTWMEGRNPLFEIGFSKLFGKLFGTDTSFWRIKNYKMALWHEIIDIHIYIYEILMFKIVDQKNANSVFFYKLNNYSIYRK